MKYAITWRERPQGSPESYEAAQRRILDVFGAWKQPEELRIHQFVTRVGSWSGYMIAEIDDISKVQPLTTALASFEFHIDPIIDVPDAIALELEGMNWRDSVGAIRRLITAGEALPARLARRQQQPRLSRYATRSVKMRM